MDGIHDIGGMDNLGRVVLETNEPLFHADWERSVFSHAIALVGGGFFNLDEVRRATEWMPPADYLQASYYETWLYSLTALLLEKRLLTPEEIELGHADPARGNSPAPALTREMALYVMNNCIPANLDLDIDPAFAPGDEVIARNIHPQHHTRLPRYVRGKCGIIEQHHGIFSLPDTNAHGGPEQPQHCYSVRFTARELWGQDADEHDAVYVDLYENYIDRVRADT